MTELQPDKSQAIGANLLTENIDVSGPGKYAPEEYDSRIMVAREKNRMMSEFPKTAAEIIGLIDEFKIDKYVIDERYKTAVQLDREELDLLDKQKLIDMHVANSVADMQLRLNSDVAAAKKKGYASGNLTEEINQVYENYRNPDEFSGSPALQRAWSQQYNRDYQRDDLDAKLSDVKTGIALSQANLEQYGYMLSSQVYSGKYTARQAVIEMLPKIQDLLKSQSPEDQVSFFGKLFNQAIRAEADAVLDGVVKAQDPVAYLSGMISSYQDVDFGNGMTVHGVLDEQTREYLRQKVGSLKSASGNDTLPMSDIVQGLKEVMGYEEFEKSGFSSNAMSFSDTAFDAEFDKALQQVTSSNKSSISKEKTINDIYGIYAKLKAGRDVKNLTVLAKANTGINLQQGREILAARINNPSLDWTNFELKVSDGTVICPKFLADKSNALTLGDANAAAYNFWREYYDSYNKMSKLYTDGEHGEFYSKIDSEYRTNENTLLSKISYSNLSQAGSVHEMAVNLKTMDVQTSQYEAGKVALSKDFIGRVLNSFDSSAGFDNTNKQIEGISKFLDACNQTGHLGEVLRYAKDAKNEKVIQSLYRIVGDKNTIDAFATMHANHTDDKINEKVDRFIKDSFHESAKADADKKVYRDLHISENEQDIYDGLKQEVLAYIALNNKNPREYESTLKKVLGTFYIQPDSNSGMAHAFFKYSPAMRLYTGVDGEQRLKTDLANTKNAVNGLCYGLGIPQASKGLQWYSDMDNGIYFKQNGKDINTYVGPSGKAGILYNSDSIKNINSNVRAEYNARRYVYNLMVNEGENGLLYSIVQKNVGNKYNRAGLIQATKRLNTPEDLEDLITRESNKRNNQSKGVQTQAESGWLGLATSSSLGVYRNPVYQQQYTDLVKQSEQNKKRMEQIQKDRDYFKKSFSKQE